MNRFFLRLKSRKGYIAKILILYQLLLFSSYIGGILGDVHNPINLTSDKNLLNNRLNSEDLPHLTFEGGFINNYDDRIFNIDGIINNSLMTLLNNQDLIEYSTIVQFFIFDYISEIDFFILVIDDLTFTSFRDNLNKADYDAMFFNRDMLEINNSFELMPEVETNKTFEFDNFLTLNANQISELKPNPISATIIDHADSNIFMIKHSILLEKMDIVEFSSDLMFTIELKIDEPSFNQIIFQKDVDVLIEDLQMSIENTINQKYGENINIFQTQGKIVRLSSNLDPIKDLITINYTIILIFLLITFLFFYFKFSFELFWKRYHLEEFFVQMEIKSISRIFFYIIESLAISMLNLILTYIFGSLFVFIANNFFENVMNSFNVSNLLILYFLINFILHFTLNLYFDIQINKYFKKSVYHETILEYSNKYYNLTIKNFVMISFLSGIFLIILGDMNILTIFLVLLLILYLAVFIYYSSNSLYNIILKILGKFNIFKIKNKDFSIISRIWENSVNSKVKYFIILITFFISLTFIQFSISLQNNYSSIFLDDSDSFFVQYEGNFNESLTNQIQQDEKILTSQVTVFSVSDLNTMNFSDRNIGNFVGLDLSELTNYYNSVFIENDLANINEIRNNFTGVIISEELHGYYNIGDLIEIYFFNSSKNDLDSINLSVQGYYTEGEIFKFSQAIVMPLELMITIFNESGIDYQTKINIKPQNDLYQTYLSVENYIDSENIFVNLENKIILDKVITKSELLLIFYFFVLIIFLFLNDNLLNPKETNLKRVLTKLSIFKDQDYVIRLVYIYEIFTINLILILSYVSLITIFALFTLFPLFGFLDIVSFILLLLEVYLNFIAESIFSMMAIILIINIFEIVSYFVTKKKHDFKAYTRFYE